MVAPLFIADLETLKKELRLSGVPETRNAHDIIESAVLESRVTFYRHLTEARVAALLAIPFTETPTTRDQRLRVLANLTEAKIVRLALFRTLPVMFMDGGADYQQSWNEEAPYRGSRSDLQMEMKRLELEISENFDLLSGAETFTNETSVRVTTMQPDEGYRPGQSVWGKG